MARITVNGGGLQSERGEKLGSSGLPASAASVGSGSATNPKVTQSGSPGYQWTFQTSGTTHTGAAFRSLFTSETYGGVIETAWTLGYNPDGALAAHRVANLKFHPDAGDVNGTEIQFTYTDDAGHTCFPFQFTGLNDGSRSGNLACQLPTQGGTFLFTTAAGQNNYLSLNGVFNSSGVATAPASAVFGSSSNPMQIQSWGITTLHQALNLSGTTGVAGSANLSLDASAAGDAAFLQLYANNGQQSMLKFADTNAVAYQIYAQSGLLVIRDGKNGVTIATMGVAAAGDIQFNGPRIGFYNTTPVVKPTVTGSKGANAALTSLLTALAGQGLLTDSST